MTSARPNLRADLTCPSCGYNLRGLREARVQCPECGAACDIAAMLRARGVLAWWDLPEYTVLMRPALWALFSPVLALPVLVCAGALMFTTSIVVPILGAVAVTAGIWWWLAQRARVLGPGAVRYAFMLQAAYFGYLFGIFGVLGGIVITGLAFDTSSLLGGPRSIIIGTVLTALAVGALFLSARWDRAVGAYCIRRHFELMNPEDPPATERA